MGGRCVSGRLFGVTGREMHDLGSAQQLPTRPQTFTPGSTRGSTRKRMIVRREFPMHTASDQGAALPKTPTIRSRGRICPLVLSPGGTLPCEPLVLTWGTLATQTSSRSAELLTVKSATVRRIRPGRSHTQNGSAGTVSAPQYGYGNLNRTRCSVGAVGLC
jgi:hypothetical protein